MSAQPPGGFLQDQTHHGVRAAQRLEAAEPEPLPLVLDVNGADAELGRERPQRVKRGRPVVGPQREPALRGIGSTGVQELGIR